MDDAPSACDVCAVLVVALLVASGLVADSLGRLADWLRGCVSNDPQESASSELPTSTELPTVQVLCLIASINTTRGQYISTTPPPPNYTLL